MSAILGVFTDAMGSAPIGDAPLGRMVGAMGARGVDRVGRWQRDGATLVVARYQWEAAEHLSGGALVVQDDRYVVAADAALYYRADLLRQLRCAGERWAPRSSPSELVLAAFRAWGDRAAERLEGDWAYLVWDRAARVLCAARDHGGKRPLYYAARGGRLVIASCVSAVTACPEVSRELNLPYLARTLSQSWQNDDETCWRDVRELVAGGTLRWEARGGVRLGRCWKPPAIGSTADGIPSFEGAAEELRSRLQQAVTERALPGDTTAVWMSGGWDSPSVFAAGASASGAAARRLRPVSISYPEGDPGREDELITSVAERWGVPVHWLEVERIPLFEEPVWRAAARDLPFAHTYELWNRALARGSRDVGARVALDGNGGDQLFQISNVFLSDLLRGGRWGTFRREWREKHARGPRALWHWAVAPALPGGVARALARLAGGAPAGADYLERNLAPWIRPEFARAHALLERERASMPARAGYRGWRREAHFLLAANALPRAFQCLAELALEEGVELRSPLYDRRIIELACTRPREERNTGRETKRLLRAAMRGLLPDDFLAPRVRRTGITVAYSDRRMREQFPALLERHLQQPLLDELGIVDARQLRPAWERYLSTGDLALKIPLFLTLQVELWLQTHTSSAPDGARTANVRWTDAFLAPAIDSSGAPALFDSCSRC